MESTQTQQEHTLKFERQPEHQWLQKLIGEWTVEGEATVEPGQPPSSFTGTESVRAIGGFWALAEGQGEMPCGGAMTSLMTLGYDPRKQRYIGTWIGSMMSHLWIYEGVSDPNGKILTLEAEGPGSTGQMATFRDVIAFDDDDHRILTSHIKGEEGQWHRFMTAHYRRVK